MNLLSGQQEYLRAAQRDSDLLRSFKAAVLQAVQMVVRPETAGRYLSEVALAAEVTYYGLCLLGRQDLPQTLGEEYVSISLANFPLLRPIKRVLGSTNYLRAAHHFFPVLPQLSLYLLLKLLLPYLIRVFSQYRDKVIRNKLVKTGTDFLPSVSDLWEKVALKLHLAAFFLWNGADEVAKTVAGLVYIRHYRAENSGPKFPILGWIVLFHGLLELFLLLKKSYFDYKIAGKTEEKREVTSEIYIEKRCGLCLDTRNKASCAPCGHVFCWDCLIAATQVKPLCPECRHPAPPETILQLRNLE